MNREAQIRSLFDTSGFGLEIGPSYNPIVAKRDGFNVEIIDHATTADLRTKYAQEPGIDISPIEEVDYVWDGRPLAQVIGETGRYDYVVASHVIEHSPDILGFLKECQTLLRPGGVLVLAVPDKRRCFDVLRPHSTIGAVLQAHHEKRSRHSPGTAFDHAAHFATLNGLPGWVEGTTGDIALVHPFSLAKELFDRSIRSSEYFDFHAWTFTPSSFRLIVKELNEMSALDLRELRFQLTPSIEFYVVLSRSAPGCSLSRLALLQQINEELLSSWWERKERFNPLMAEYPQLG
jgi:SAM-dependent methyltransferase